jgi:hypothetical protein
MISPHLLKLRHELDRALTPSTAEHCFREFVCTASQSEYRAGTSLYLGWLSEHRRAVYQIDGEAPQVRP